MALVDAQVARPASKKKAGNKPRRWGWGLMMPSTAVVPAPSPACRHGGRSPEACPAWQLPRHPSQHCHKRASQQVSEQQLKAPNAGCHPPGRTRVLERVANVRGDLAGCTARGRVPVHAVVLDLVPLLRHGDTGWSARVGGARGSQPAAAPGAHSWTKSRSIGAAPGAPLELASPESQLPSCGLMTAAQQGGTAQRYRCPPGWPT